MDEAFVAFPKISRLNRPVIISEKIDGTNASVHVFEDGRVLAGSRTRWITPSDDNFGFAKWVKEHEEELRGLGPGAHYGEWWGLGIQRNYGLTEKRFSLFNTSRWNADTKPACCHVVPVLGTADSLACASRVGDIVATMKACGSAAVPGFMKPEGVVVFHEASGGLFKATLENDQESKAQADRRRAWEAGKGKL